MADYRAIKNAAERIFGLSLIRLVFPTNRDNVLLASVIANIAGPTNFFNQMREFATAPANPEN
jgi:hypothetical protein